MIIMKSMLAAAVSVAASLMPCSAGAATFTTLYSFAGGDDGGSSTGSLTYLNGMLYGTTADGGYIGFQSTYGTIFKLDPTTGIEAVLHEFANGTDSAYPQSNLLYHDGVFYGTSSGDFEGGYAGAMFSVDPSNGAFSVLHDFGSTTQDARYPYAGTVFADKKLYGASTIGGLGGTGSGTVYSFDLVTGVESVVYSFNGKPDGANPFGNLLYKSGIFYGTTAGGGTANNGTVFSFDPKSGTETIMHSFAGGADGGRPVGGLIDVGGVLYGTTQVGGASGFGTIFQIDIKTGTESVLHSFAGGTDGEYPWCTLLYRGGVLYGTTTQGGVGKAGTIFRFDVKSGTERVLYGFGGGDGGYPYAGLIYEDGALYGTTSGGGTYGYGTVFKLVP
jgi:uncharacterized repeat protein (TIGR03803 family)